MPLLGFLYPCTVLARLGGPLSIARERQTFACRERDLMAEVADRIARALRVLPVPYAVDDLRCTRLRRSSRRAAPGTRAVVVSAGMG